LQDYLELKKYVNSAKFIKVKEYMALPGKKRFEDTDEYEKLQKYLNLKSNQTYKNYYRFLKYKGIQDFNTLHNSKKLEEYKNLEKYINSLEFRQKESSMTKKDFKMSEEFSKAEELKKIQKSPEFRNYFKLVKKPEVNDYLKLYNSQEIKIYEELKDYINCDDFILKEKQIIKKKFKDTKEYNKEHEYLQKHNSKEIKTYFKFKNSSFYSNFLNLDNSDRIKLYEELDKFIHSDDFINLKEYMGYSSKKKYELSDEYKKENSYYELKKSDIIAWYFKLYKSNKFDDLKRWELTFEDDFNTNKLNEKKWMTRYFWGDYFLNEGYSLATDNHYTTDGKNIEIKDSILTIITKKESVKGKAWDTTLGFYPKDFEYTSGLISSAHSFRQKFGIFEAKIRLNDSFPVNHAFWLISDHMLPQIDILKSNKKLTMNNYWTNSNTNLATKNVSKVLFSKFNNDFYIFSLEWTSEKLVWKINDITVCTQTNGIPQEPMYVILSSGLYRKIDDGKLPAKMDIDWVRCYQERP